MIPRSHRHRRRQFTAALCLSASVACHAPRPGSNGQPASAVIADASSATSLDDSARTVIVSRLSQRLDSLYVSTDLAKTLSIFLEKRLRDHAYDAIATPRAFADSLSHDLDTVAHDFHLWVRYFPPLGASMGGPDLDETWLNHGYPSVRILDGNVAYIDVRSFTANADADRASDAAMTLVKDGDALILDLRNNGGGTTPAMARLAGYFFADSAHLSDLHWRDTGDTIHVWTHAHPGVSLDRQPLFILTSRRTFSAAENFAYSLRSVHRAILVGETTRGGAHTAKGLANLGYGIRALIPAGELLDPTTKLNWERVGVKPDIAAPDSVALDVAHRTALQQLLRDAPAGARRERLQRTLRSLETRAYR